MSKKPYGVIYKATCLITNKSYIGLTTKSLKRRKSNHLTIAKYNHSESYFHRAINKYGKGNFEWIIIEECHDDYGLNLAEEWHIRYFNTLAPNGFNIQTGGRFVEHNGRKVKGSKEFKELLSEKMKALWKTEEHRKKCCGENHYMYGKKQSKENNRKNREAQKKVWTKEKNKVMSVIIKKICKTKEWRENHSIGIKKGLEKRKRYYKAISPNGEETIVNSLTIRDFCKSNDLNYSNMMGVLNGWQSHHKGWKCVRIYKEVNCE